MNEQTENVSSIFKFQSFTRSRSGITVCCGGGSVVVVFRPILVLSLSQAEQKDVDKFSLFKALFNLKKMSQIVAQKCF